MAVLMTKAPDISLQHISDTQIHIAISDLNPVHVINYDGSLNMSDTIQSDRYGTGKSFPAPDASCPHFVQSGNISMATPLLPNSTISITSDTLNYDIGPSAAVGLYEHGSDMPISGLNSGVIFDMV